MLLYCAIGEINFVMETNFFWTLNLFSLSQRKIDVRRVKLPNFQQLHSRISHFFVRLLSDITKSRFNAKGGGNGKKGGKRKVGVLLINIQITSLHISFPYFHFNPFPSLPPHAAAILLFFLGGWEVLVVRFSFPFGS